MTANRGRLQSQDVRCCRQTKEKPSGKQPGHLKDIGCDWLRRDAGREMRTKKQSSVVGRRYPMVEPSMAPAPAQAARRTRTLGLMTAIAAENTEVEENCGCAVGVEKGNERDAVETV